MAAAIKKKGKMTHDSPLKLFTELSKSEQKHALMVAAEEGYNKKDAKKVLYIYVPAKDTYNIVDKDKIVNQKFF